jgi:hypothetical protein
MSDQAFEVYEKDLEVQHTRNEARRIRTRVNEARRSPHIAGIRWPFELLQNALDAGPRPGSAAVTIALRHQDRTVVFEHDGAPFSSPEIAALLSGGSSKDFESEDTTGRFGTGFLVTHVLAERTRLEGLLAIGPDNERFQLVLDRGGDEDAILNNIYACNDAIRAAVAVRSLDGVPSARFEYVLDSTDYLVLGMESLRQALPYLYATRSTLGQVTIQSHDGEIETWTPSPVGSKKVEEGVVYHRNVSIRRGGGTKPVKIRVLRFMTRANAHAAALVVLRKETSGWQVIIPDPDRPRIYREYPLWGSEFLPVNFVLDGKFDPDQERSRLLMSDDDRRLVEESLSAAVVGVSKAVAERWRDAHLLARASVPKSGFDPTNAEEKQWWTSQMASFATRLAALPIVDTGDRMLRAAPGEGPFADFVAARLSTASPSDETTVDRLWPLVDSADALIPSRQEFAADWTLTAQGWDALGVKLNLITLQKLAEEVLPTDLLLEQLKVKGDKREWLAKFVDVVGECWEMRGSHDESILNGLLLDQSGRLKSPEDLKQDGGANEELKDICGAIDLDVRGSLLDLALLAWGQRLNLTHLVAALNTAVDATVSESDVIEDCLAHLDDKLPENSDYEPSDEAYLQGSIRLLDYLFRSQGNAAEVVAKKVPFVTLNDRVVQWNRDRMLMAPVSSWHPSAQQFSKAYPADRVLTGAYAGAADGNVPNIIAALAAWGIVYADPLATNTPAELRDRRLAAIAENKDQASGVVVSGCQFSQIALLQPELINRCRAGVDEACALLGLVLCHIAPNDPCWKESRTVTGRKGGQEVTIKVYGALWLADLTFQAWVPVPDADGNVNQMTASPLTLQGLLNPNPSWLEHNDAAIALLSRWFDFDELELRLLGTTPDPGQRKELRNSLARLVESGGSDPRIYEALAQEVEARRNRARDIARCRRFGLAIQDAISLALEARNLTLKLIDRGYDFEVLPQTEDVLTGAGCRIEVGPYLLEVKATTTGQARMTPTQAATASAEATRYVLCVVDLREVSEERLDGQWTAADVAPLAAMVTNIGNEVAETCQHIDKARHSDVAIRNEEALRYEVPVEVWKRGISINEWVEQLLRSHAPEKVATPETSAAGPL